MIIDSHAHYNNNTYKKPCRYLTYGMDGYALREGGTGAAVPGSSGCKRPLFHRTGRESAILRRSAAAVL